MFPGSFLAINSETAENEHSAAIRGVVRGDVIQIFKGS